MGRWVWGCRVDRKIFVVFGRDRRRGVGVLGIRKCDLWVGWLFLRKFILYFCNF